jgi:hypothetical protein
MIFPGDFEMKDWQKTILNKIVQIKNNDGRLIIPSRCPEKRMTLITEYGKGFKDGYYQALHTIYQSLKASKAAESTPNISSPIQGILDGLEIMMKQNNEG